MEKKGKTYETLYGTQRAKELRKKLSKAHKGLQANEKHPLFRKDLDNSEIIKLYLEHKSFKYLAKLLNCSYTTIKDRLIKEGVPIFKLNEIPIREETKIKQRNAKLGKINFSRLGKKHSEETKQLIKRKLKQVKISRKNTSIERRINDYLTELDINFIPQKYIEIEHGFKCDFFVSGMNLIIECDGTYWHNLSAQKEKDKIHNWELFHAGYNLIRLEEKEIKSMSLEGFNQRLDGGYCG